MTDFKLSRKDKIQKSNRAFADVLNNLQLKDKQAHINRAAPKNYNIIINGEIVKNYKQRRSAKRYLTRLLTNLNK